MVSVASLGVHEPSALPLLVAEGILPHDPGQNSYKWQTWSETTSLGETNEEELLSTENCVAWSKAGVIQRIFRFEAEEEPVTHALFARLSAKGNVGPGSRAAAFSRTEEETKEHSESRKFAVHEAVPSKAGRLSSDIERSQNGRRDWKENDSSARALVVVLKTQAHVFFIPGTSQVVHLPFEVEAVYPLPIGLLLQRKSTTRSSKPAATPQLPPPPQNTFAFSQASFLNSSNPKEPPPGQWDGLDRNFSGLFQMLAGKSARSLTDRLPRQYCLLNPLEELGIIIRASGQAARTSTKPLAQERSTFTDLDLDERLIYVSARDERKASPLEIITEDSILFAVTSNDRSGRISLWEVLYLENETSKSARSQNLKEQRNENPRRRGSHGRVVSTGATTPIPPAPVPGRDSLGASQSFAKAGRDSIVNDGRFYDADGDPLDQALDEVSGPTKSSRRVSSLLARSDLAASHDRTTLNDFAVGTGKRQTRRGLSFGQTDGRLSIGGAVSSKPRKPPPLGELRSSLGSVNLSDNEATGLLDNMYDANEKGQKHTVGLSRSNRAFPKVLGFRKIHTSRESLALGLEPGGISRPHVFTLGLSSRTLGSHDLGGVYVYIFNPSNQELVLLEVRPIQRTTQRFAKARKEDTQRFRFHSFGVLERKMTGVIDVCKLRDGEVSRALFLHQEENGRCILSLQAPWSHSMKVELPHYLNMTNPWSITNDKTIWQKREDGFRKVLSQGPEYLAHLERADEQCAVDVIDLSGVSHRIRLQLRPHNHLVRRIIDVCDAVLPTSDTHAETILQAWLDVKSWLEARPEHENEPEWIAIVVTLFSLAAPFIHGKPIESIRHQKRRRAGLMRSPSGAYTDLDSWDGMLSEEHDLIRNTPWWTASTAWSWIGGEVKPSDATSTQRPRLTFSHTSPSSIPTVPIPEKSDQILRSVSLAQEYIRSPLGQIATGPQGYLPIATSMDSQLRNTALPTVLVAIHLLREELKLDVFATSDVHKLTPILAQIGGWLGWQNWSFGVGSYYASESVFMDGFLFQNSSISGLRQPSEPFMPPSLLQFVESSYADPHKTFLSLSDVADMSEPTSKDYKTLQARHEILEALTPRTVVISTFLASRGRESAEVCVEKMISCGLTKPLLESFPEGIAASFRTALVSCQSRPSTLWGSELLNQVERDDLAQLGQADANGALQGQSRSSKPRDAPRDVHNACRTALEAEPLGPYDGAAEIDRQAITRLLFKDDQRFAEAAKLLHPLLYPVARCMPEPEWSETDLLEAQQELVKVVALRTLSVSLGRGLIFYTARSPLLTEKFPIHGFTLSCVMKPADTTVTADRTIYTEEKVSWAFFHAGVEAGLSISKSAKGVDTSWILFNKPRELNNRHAGFLLAMGLNGHLKSIAKWLAFKYLTPKHSITSAGFLLGLSASYLGTMDTLITRLLSVHVTRMLPLGAAELNLSPLTQTSGLMGIGLLYCKTQHRRMSEVMLSEMENADEEASPGARDGLRDEGYRLAAGFALGFINLGLGRDLRGLHDMYVVKRLLALAISPKEADRVHILDRATAGATIAIALIFMKTEDETLARKVDIPDTVHQFEYVRPDHFLLRTIACHLIMWQNIRATFSWMKRNVCSEYRVAFNLTSIRILTSEDLPFLCTVAGLCFVVGLRYAGSGSTDARDLLCHYLHHYMRICRLPTLNYDGKLARITVRNCQDLVALAAACVMAGTGDLQVFRYLRSLHGRTDAETPYGSHLAAHFAIGALFLGGGTHTFGTSDLATAALLCAFYPLFPSSVLDNKSHLQAFRHFWVLATEPRCLVARDVETHQPISLSILVTSTSGSQIHMTIPCLLPEIHTITKIQSTDPDFWQIDLDLRNNPKHLAAVTRYQSIYVRRRAAYESHGSSVFSTTMQALNDAQLVVVDRMNMQQHLRWIFSLRAFAGFDRAAQALVLPAADHPSAAIVFKGTRGTVLDDRLVLQRACLSSGTSEKLWNLRILLAWAEGVARRANGGANGDGDGPRWISREVVDSLKAALALRRRQAKART